jgi:hypothetical protein
MSEGFEGKVSGGHSNWITPLNPEFHRAPPII